jgi:hypothetical protein
MKSAGVVEEEQPGVSTIAAINSEKRITPYYYGERSRSVVVASGIGLGLLYDFLAHARQLFTARLFRAEGLTP